MSAKSEKILRDFTQSLTQPKGTSAYDTTAKVLRVENGTAWVHIPGGVDETPVKLTIDAKEGDVVQVRVSGGRAFLIGNATSPPTDDAAANAANKRAVNADKKAGVARQTAEEADGKATEAKEIAEEAGEAVAEVAQHFWTDEDGAHITEVTQEEYIDDPESAGSNTLLDSDGMYIRDGVTNKASFGLVTRIGEEDKARIEITDESFKQVTDNDVTAVDIQSSGATAETTIIRERMQHVYIPQTTRRSNSDSREAVATILANIYDTDSLIDVSYAPVTFTWGWGASKSQAQETLHTYTITQSQLEQITDSSTYITLETKNILSNATMSLELRLIRSNVDGESYHKFTARFYIRYVNSMVSVSATFPSFYVYLEKVTNKKKAYVPSIELNGDITFKRPTDVFMVKTYTHTYSNVSSGNNMDWTEDIEEEGYYPIGVMGVYLARAALCITQCRIYDRAVGSCTLRVNARAVAAVSGTTCSAQILWVKCE